MQTVSAAHPFNSLVKKNLKSEKSGHSRFFHVCCDRLGPWLPGSFIDRVIPPGPVYSKACARKLYVIEKGHVHLSIHDSTLKGHITAPGAGVVLQRFGWFTLGYFSQ